MTANPISLSISNARFKMIEQQIRPWNVSDKEVLSVLNIVKREAFVTDAQTNLAFMDILLPINNNANSANSGEVMLEPKLEARVLQTIKPTGKEDVLEIGTGSGYMAALLGYFAKHVTTVEINPDLAKFAQENLNKSRIPNVTVNVGDAAHGWANGQSQSYDIIVVSGGLPQVSKTLQAQLKIGGRLLAFVGNEPVMSAVLITRVSQDYYKTEILFETLVPMLKVAKSELENFVF